MSANDEPSLRGVIALLPFPAPLRRMKTTIDIQDELLERAKRRASETGRSLRAVVEEGFRLVLSKEPSAKRYILLDRSYGGPEVHDPLASYTQSELREIIYRDDPGH